MYMHNNQYNIHTFICTRSKESEKCAVCEPAASLPDILQGMITQYQSQDEASTNLTIRRKHVWRDSVIAFSRESFDPYKKVKVCFVGEEAIDYGGPSREYWRLLNKAIVEESHLFEGNPHRKVLVHDVEALSKRLYYLCGKMITASILHSGLGPKCFSPAVYSYLCQVEPKPIMEDLADFEERAVVEQVTPQLNASTNMSYYHSVLINLIMLKNTG